MTGFWFRSHFIQLSHRSPFGYRWSIWASVPAARPRALRSGCTRIITTVVCSGTAITKRGAASRARRRIKAHDRRPFR